MERFRSACFITFLVLIFVHGQYAQSPCPKYFEYRSGASGMYGIVHVYPIGRPNWDKIEARVEYTVTESVSSVGHIRTLDGSDAALIQQFNSGSPIDFAVVFPATSVVPKITSIKINDVVICTGPGDDKGPSLTEVGITHTFFATNTHTNGLPLGPSMPHAPSVISAEDDQEFPGLTFAKPVRPSWTIGSQTIPETPFQQFLKANQDINRFKQFHTIERPDVFERDPFFNRGTQTSAFQRNPRPPVTLPPATRRPVTLPPATRRPTTRPPATRPPTTQPPPTRPPTTKPPTTPRPPPVITTPRPQPQTTKAPVSTCGQKMTLDNTPVQPLIFGGMSVNRGDWPWLVAIFKRKDVGLSYICSGTLLSTRHVVTAAHCMRRTTSLTSINDIVVKAGVHNIRDWGDDDITVTRILSSATIHPAYNASTLSNDILLLKFTRPVPINAYIKPICIWSGTDDLNLVVGAVGVVAGWGVSEIGPAGRGEPRMIRMPIVSTTVCRASNSDFHKLTSYTTLCAGDKNSAGPCLGDSGGGLYLVHDGRWTLRGIVSVSLVSGNGDLTCNLNEFVVFTDAAKFAKWILDSA